MFGSRKAGLGRVSSFNRWASVKDGLEGLLSHGLKLNFHRYIGQLRRLPPPLQNTPWRRFFVHEWRACEDNDYVHAERNDEDVSQNCRRFKYFQLLQPQWAGRLTRLSNIIITLCPHDASLLTLLVDLARFLCTYGVRMLCNWPNFSMTENRHRNASSVHDFTVFNQQVSKKRFSAFYPPILSSANDGFTTM